ncbi:MAG: hypothetical protein Q3999_04560 [Buchananella hordeovulneris]|nr:hypothetical protein [Buchananella hordeovulneris]
MRKMRFTALVASCALAVAGLAGCSKDDAGQAAALGGEGQAEQSKAPEAEEPFTTPLTASSPGPDEVGVYGEQALYLTGLEVGKAYTRPNAMEPAEGVGQEVKETTGMTREVVAAWDSLQVLDAHKLRVHFLGGAPACFGYRMAAEEGEGVLRLALVEGRVSDAEACDMQAFANFIDVNVKQDLTKIALVEGALGTVNLNN